MAVDPSGDVVVEADVREFRAARDRRQAALAAVTLEERARLFAQTHTLAQGGVNGFDFRKRLDGMETLLNQGYQHYVQASDVRLKSSYVAEWLLDNFYLVVQTLRQIREDMPTGYYRRLPRVHSLVFGQAPRIYAFVQIFLTSCQGQVDIDSLDRFVRAYQEVSPLDLGELWALPTMLRYGILHCLTCAVVRSAGIQAPPRMQEFISQGVPCVWGDEATVSFAFLSLRAASAIEWEAFVEEHSLVNDILLQDPAGAYVQMDFYTRNRYRQAVEDLASRSRQEELAVARLALSLAQAAAGQMDGQPGDVSDGAVRYAHVGHYLIQAGRTGLERRLGYRPAWRSRLLRLVLRHPALFYLGIIAALSAVLLLASGWPVLAWGGAAWQMVLFVLAGLVPAVSAAVGLVNWWITHLVPPRPLPRLDFTKGIPVEYKTTVVVPCLLSNAAEVDGLLQQIELHYLGNADPILHFVLLSDDPDASQQYVDGDGALLEQAERGVRTLNQRYGHGEEDGPFLLFHRPRRWNPGEACWMAWERKRGKLKNFNQFLLDEEDHFSHKVGNLIALQGTRYVITLDADTGLPRGSAARLVGTLAHPLNRARFGPQGQVVAGYTILQPRLQTRPAAVDCTHFTRIFAGESGLDPYTLAVSDVYQDLFGEGSYVGKGIYDLAAFERSLRGRVPENALLSHDLFEGIHGRAGLVTDIILFEDFPSHYLVSAHRRHRWVRGDWQLLPWLASRTWRAGGPERNDLSFIDRWKILDNLRRSLFPPSLLALLVLGWLLLPPPAAYWVAIAVLARATPVITSLLAHTTRQSDKLEHHWGVVTRSVTQVSLALVFLPYEAVINLDAIASTLFRMFISHQHLLQWRTMAHSARLFGKSRRLALIWAQMRIAPLMAIGLEVVLLAFRPAAMAVAAPFLLAWLLSPLIAHWISRPLARRPEPLTEAQLRMLRRLSCRTWFFFEHFANPAGNWLPPDHFQENPRGQVVLHTSPTNIGMLLVSTLAAHDLGYIGPLVLSLRLGFAMQAMQSLERYQGHFLNWYEISTLRSLSPRYISTVDSGNLAACLVVVAQGLEEIPGTALLRQETWSGFLDVLDVLEECLTLIGLPALTQPAIACLAHIRQSALETLSSPEDWSDLLVRLRGPQMAELEKELVALVEGNANQIAPALLSGLRGWSERVNYHLESLRKELSILAPWLENLQQPPDVAGCPQAESLLREALPSLRAMLRLDIPLGDFPNVCQQAENIVLCLAENLQSLDTPLLAWGDPQKSCLRQALVWCQRLRAHLESGLLNVQDLLADIRVLCATARRLQAEMDFRFLFEPHRQIFHIGYNLDTERLDEHYYDLLASEARLASYLAIAYDQVPQSHWLRLSRPVTRLKGKLALLSWSGSMFEYLMPHLFMQSYPQTFLHQSCQAAVHRQAAYGRQIHTPWGVSEAGYYHFDEQQNYQYRAFGVPGLGFKRGLGDDRVIAPYASLLALDFAPRRVVDNLAVLARLGALGSYGFYESLDFTPSRLGAGDDYQVVRSYYAHHQGMILAALDNFLCRGAMVRRFHACPQIHNVDLLLREFVPRAAPVEKLHFEAHRTSPAQPLHSPDDLRPWNPDLNAPVPQVQLLSNGHFSTLITQHGGGYCTWDGIALTRWRADPTLDHWGSWIYIQDVDRRRVWSATQQPYGILPDAYQVSFYHHKVTFQRHDHGITTHLEVVVPPDDDLEIRLLTLSNRSEIPRRLRILSYSEVVMAAQADDRRHPAFNKLYIENVAVGDVGEAGSGLDPSSTIICRRRPRSAAERAFYLGHCLVYGDIAGDCFVVHSRADFLGRNRDSRSPRVLQCSTDGLYIDAGTGLDPILSCGIELEIPPRRSTSLAFLTAAAGTGERLSVLLKTYRDWASIQRSFGQARSFTIDELKKLGLAADTLADAQRLLSLLLYPHRMLRAPADALAANRLGQPGLWKFSISGDDPIVLVRVRNEEDSSLVLELLKAHAYWRSYDLQIDLVLLNLHDTGYNNELHNYLYRLLQSTGAELWLNRRGGVYLLRAELLSAEERILLEVAARAILDSSRGSLGQQLNLPFGVASLLPRFLPILPEDERIDTPPLQRPDNLLFDNDWGGFSPDGREYVVYLRSGHPTPAPWINVIATPQIGFTLSETGGGYTWANNSGENRLTPWRNDPLLDHPGEAFYLRDEETGRFWSPTPLPAGDGEPYLVRHGAGYTIFQHNSYGFCQQLSCFALPSAPIKVMQLNLENTTPRIRHVTVTCYVEWVLGPDRETMQQYVFNEFDVPHNALLARSAYHAEFGESVAFLASTREPTGLTTDRQEFLGSLGCLRQPGALLRVSLTGQVQAGCDPCAVLQMALWIGPGETKQTTFLLGQAPTRSAALALLDEYRHIDRIEQGWREVNETWERLLGAVTVRTPDPALDLLLNRWLLYQALSCRVWGRSALYQSSGAFGFRDQLQDVLSLLHAAPELARQHILEAARHQFEAGDVLHWWHPPSGRGVRTRCSDDLLWLPYVTACYVQASDDWGILDELVDFLDGAPLGDGEQERYAYYPVAHSAGERSLFEHCRRALEKGTTCGAHGLPLMGSHDWNDGMNRVGVQGKGESVWNAWFLYDTLIRFAALCEHTGRSQQAVLYRQQAAQLREKTEQYAWDGDWYLRAFYDDGQPLGSAASSEAQIDSLPQSWAVLSRAADPARARQSLESVDRRLVQRDTRLVLLFTPPFNHSTHNPGYIMGYPPGIRENGGQYTHAATWVAWAFACLGDGDRAAELFRLLNPILRAVTPQDVARYRVEPYVIAADIYSVPPYVGRGGWTWYTGSAAWMYRLGLEAILGLQRVGDGLLLDPCLPRDWSAYQVDYRCGSALYRIRVENPRRVNRGVRRLLVDGQLLPDHRLPLSRQVGEHQVLVELGPLTLSD